MSLARALATHLTGLGVVAYADFETSDTFLGVLPDSPDALIGIFQLAGTADRMDDTSADVSLRIVVRGGREDPLSAEDRALAVYRALRDTRAAMWGDPEDGGVFVARCQADPPSGGNRDRLARTTYAIFAHVRAHLG